MSALKDASSNSEACPREVVRELKVVNPLGLHARPAAMFVKTASGFDADVTVERDGNRVSGKSIMGLMTLQAECGTILRVTAAGREARDVVEQLERLFLDEFREGLEDES